MVQRAGGGVLGETPSLSTDVQQPSAVAAQHSLPERFREVAITPMNNPQLAETNVVQVSRSTPPAESLDPTAPSIGKRFLALLAARDFQRLEDCFHTDVRFRALVPSGLREGIGSQVTVAWLRRWFEATDLFEMQRMHADMVADRLHLRYRIRLRKEGLMHVIEQHAYCVVVDGRVTEMNLLCSGFRPETLY